MSRGLPTPQRPVLAPGRARLLLTLFRKEVKRLQRNPAALMAVLLLVLMSVLVSIEARPEAPSGRRAAAQACVIAHGPGDELAAYLARHAGERLPVRFLEVPDPRRLRYPRGLPCAAEIVPVASAGAAAPERRRIVFRYDGDRARAERLARWVLAGMAAQASGASIEQAMEPFAAGHGLDQRGLGQVNLSAGKTRALVGTVLIYSALFFVCCAMFISFSAHERERGIAQALALTPAGPTMALFAKLIFHLTLGAGACAVMLAVLAPWMLVSPVAWAILLTTALGLLSVAALVVSFTRTQTAASLVGFSYLMGVGAVFALSGSFPAFGYVRALMFEHHALAALAALFEPELKASVATLLESLLGMALTVPMLLIVSVLVWRKRAWTHG